MSNFLFFPFNQFVLFYENIIYLTFSIIASIFFFIFLKKKYYNKLNLNIFAFILLFFTFIELFVFSNLQWALPEGFYKNEFSNLNFKKKFN